MQPSAGWYPDPLHPDLLAYWDGAEWQPDAGTRPMVREQWRYVSFLPAIASGLKRFNDFSGRSSRSEYWWWRLFMWLVTTLPMRFAGNVSPATLDACQSGHKSYLNCTLFAHDNALYLLGIAMSVILFVPDLALAVRRLHDIGKTGWWALVFIGIPFLTILAPVALGTAVLMLVIIFVIAIWEILWFVRVGEGSANQWGMVPQYPR